jgi:hypothetical protein
MWLALPGTDVEVIEDDIYMLTGLIGGAIGEKAMGGATFANVAL